MDKANAIISFRKKNNKYPTKSSKDVEEVKLAEFLGSQIQAYKKNKPYVDFLIDDVREHAPNRLEQKERDDKRSPQDKSTDIITFYEQHSEYPPTDYPLGKFLGSQLQAYKNKKVHAVEFLIKHVLEHAPERLDVGRSPSLDNSCAGPSYITALSKRNIQYAETNSVPAHQTFKNSHDDRIWRLVDPKGHTNPYWNASCTNIASGKLSRCPFPGITPSPTKTCSDKCPVCTGYTCADPSYIEELALRNIQYAETNDIPANQTFKRSNQTRIWRLIDPMGHTNPYWTATCDNIASGTQSRNRCPFPGVCYQSQKICSEDCPVCIGYTIADPLCIENLALRNIRYADEKPALETFKGTSEKRRFVLINTKGHVNPYFVSNVKDVVNGSGCMYPGVCPNPLTICSEDCLECIRYTIVDPQHVVYLESRGITYSDTNEVPANRTFKYTADKRVWNHSTCGEKFTASVSKISGGRSCNKCYLKTQYLVRTVVERWALTVGGTLGEFSFAWCVNHTTGCKLPFDIVVYINGVPCIIIEVDGPHHFVSGSIYFSAHTNDHVAQLQKDTYKAWCAHVNKCTLVRIAQADVWEGGVGWEETLVGSLNEALAHSTPSYISVDQTVYYNHHLAFQKAVADNMATYSSNGDVDEDM